MSQNNKEHTIHNTENSPLQVSKSCVDMVDFKFNLLAPEFGI
jgi:hypothetical protein